MSEHKPRAIRLVEDPWATVRHIVEAVALVAAGAWAFYTFIYQEKIKPAGEPAVLDDSITVQRMGQDRTRDVLEISMHLHDEGKTQIEIAADGFNVWGDRYASNVTQTSLDLPNDKAYHNGDALVSERLISSFVELRDPAVGGKVGVHSTLDPGETVTIPAIIVVPRGAYDVIRAQVIAVSVKTPVRTRVSVHVERKPDGSFVLHPRAPGVFEDDNSIYFGLLPD
jgi:hypothetical protein